MLQRKNTANETTDGCVCKPLMPDVVSPKAHQNDHSYVSSADLPSNSLRKFSMVGVYAEYLEKPQNCQNWGVAAGLGIDTCQRQYGSHVCLVRE